MNIKRQTELLLFNFENSYKRNRAFSMKRALQIFTNNGMINGELAWQAGQPEGRQQSVTAKK